tara:strand:- start:275 stop:490 length:216 start_codon:yes stop_codon:yes gene_type:complete
MLRASNSITAIAADPTNTLSSYLKHYATMAVIATGGYVLNAIKEHQPYIVLAYMFAVIVLAQIMVVSYNNR